MTQRQALNIMLDGHHVFLTGPPGSGKTYVLGTYISQARKRGLKVAVTATTGIAATLVEGLTVHAWSGIGLKDNLTSVEKYKILQNHRLRQRYLDTDILVIDEISMLDRARLDLLNELAQMFRKSKEAMGGIQLIMVGDLFQLPPVSVLKDPYIFNAKLWPALKLKICYLSEQHRQSPGDEINPVLDAIRSNRVSQAELSVLKSKLNEHRSDKNHRLNIFSHNKEVDELNKQKLMEISSAAKVYKMTTKGPKHEVRLLKEGLLTPPKLILKVGCQIIFTANNYEAGYVNGDLGKVVGFQNGLPIVRMKRAAYLVVERHHFRRQVNDQVVAEAWQLPLKLAWAITVHKSQGMSLDEARIDLGRAFSLGMGYVALSRLRSIDGLSLTGLNKVALYVDDRILKVDKLLRTQSEELVLRLSR